MPTLSNLADGLIHWWSMDETQSLRIDHIGTKNLTSHGATYDAGPGGIGLAALFDASNNEYLDVSSTNESTDTLSVGDGEFTINFFLRIDDIATAQQFILGKNSIYNGDGEYSVGWNPPNAIEVTWCGDVATFTISPNPTAGTWYMVTIYKDSDVYGATVNASILPAESAVIDEYRTSDSFYVGGFSSGSNNLTGAVNGVGFWNRRLTQDELNDLANFLDNNGYVPSYTDIITITNPSRSDFDETCAVGIDCCEEYVEYSSESATGTLPDCPTDVSIVFNPTSGSYVQFPTYATITTNSPIGTIRYAEFGLEPDETSQEYTGPILLETAGNLITAQVFYDECPPSAQFGLQYIPPSNLGAELVFTYHCSMPDNVGLWDDFTSNGVDDNYWSLVFDLVSGITINRIDIFQLDSNGEWTSGSVWSTTTPIYPFGNEFDSFDPLPLGVFESSIQVNTDYDVPSPLIALGAGVQTLELYGNPITDVAGYFKAAIYLSTGEVIYSIISADSCDAGAPPASVCSSPPTPTLTPTCSGVDVAYSMTVGSLVRIYRKRADSTTGFIRIYDDTVGSDPETYNDTGLVAGLAYTYYVSEKATGCGWYDSPAVTVFPLAAPTASWSFSPSSTDPGDPITITWNATGVTTVDITSDAGAFDLGTVSSSGSSTIDPGPLVDWCFYLEATNSCGTVNLENCITVNLAVPASCPGSLNDMYTVDEVASSGTSIFTTTEDPLAADCTRYPSPFGGPPEWNGTMLRIDGNDCQWEVGSGSTSYLGTAVPNFNITQIGIKVILSFTAGVEWTLTIECRECTTCNILWQGTKGYGTQPGGVYSRTSGLYNGPATLTIT